MSEQTIIDIIASNKNVDRRDCTPAMKTIIKKLIAAGRVQKHKGYGGMVTYTTTETAQLEYARIVTPNGDGTHKVDFVLVK